MLPTAEIIRSMRREKNVTQDELAQVLGVSFQAVSRWENGQAYPDIELLPKIAEFFGITTDRLLGADERAKLKKRIETLEAYNRAYHAADDGFGKYEVMARAIEEFPDSEPFMDMALYELIYNNALPREKALPIVREYCRKLIEKSGDADLRQRALCDIFRYEDEDCLNEWSRYVSEVFTLPQLLAKRYAHLGKADQYNLQAQKNLLNSILNCFASDFTYRPSPKEYPPSPEGPELILRMTDVLRDPARDADAWILWRAHQLVYLSAGRFACGDRTGGYDALEESVRLCEIIFRLPVGRELSYNTPVLNQLRVRVTEKLPMRNDTICAAAAFNLNYPILSGDDEWLWFDCVRDEPRFRACVERMEKYKPAEPD